MIRPRHCREHFGFTAQTQQALPQTQPQLHPFQTAHPAGTAAAAPAAAPHPPAKSGYPPSTHWTPPCPHRYANWWHNWRALEVCGTRDGAPLADYQGGAIYVLMVSSIRRCHETAIQRPYPGHLRLRTGSCSIRLRGAKVWLTALPRTTVWANSANCRSACCTPCGVNSPSMAASPRSATSAISPGKAPTACSICFPTPVSPGEWPACPIRAKKPGLICNPPVNPPFPVFHFWLATSVAARFAPRRFR